MRIILCINFLSHQPHGEEDTVVRQLLLIMSEQIKHQVQYFNITGALSIGKLVAVEVGMLSVTWYCLYEKLSFYMNEGNHDTISEKLFHSF